MQDKFREIAADNEFEDAPLEGLEDFERGWTRDGNYWSKLLYWKNPTNPDGDSHTGSYGVEFEAGTDKIIDSWIQ
jgi:hypothetical protein